MKLLVWGTGLVADRFMSTVKQDIIGFISKEKPSDNFKKKWGGGGKRAFYTADLINSMEYDYLIVATGYSEEIYKECEKYNLKLNKIIFLLDNANYNRVIFNLKNIEDDIYDKKSFFAKMKIDQDEQIIIPKMQFEKTENSNCKGMFDYVRYRIFELVANEIVSKNINGKIAELGVFRGEFAAIINEKFYNRQLYLFDTFEGFNAEELSQDIEKGYLDQEVADSFKNTSVELVLSKMRFPNQCIVKKGFFPQTAKEIEEKFVFVSIDVDLEEPIYNGLEYFYPRLEEGGYIFVHDYNSSFKGVRNAIRRYEDEYGHIAKVPICDFDGTVVIVK